VEGPLQSALLSLYMLVAVLPAVLVIEEYFDAHPAALANRLIHHYGLNAATASLLRDVLADSRVHELGSALFAIAGALFFGLGFGRVLQLVHMRAWRVSVPSRATDQGLYAAVLLGLYGLIVLLLFQLNELKGHPWEGRVLVLGWVALLVLFFTWAPSLLLHGQVSRRDLLPGAVLTAVGLVVLTVVSRWVMESWVNLYARDYGGLGVVLAIYFWIAFYSFVIVAAASLAPALAQRRGVSDDS
jgi:membrane protein